ncbi:O-antigen/teichoic acid export membrane protein [Salinibacter ruber]|nr:oligosaccharide flippase family protein [Salinibacter ruber]MCS3749289.1 O-antigen/teichoic acid export membrane protein [Salinibacter ruber]
MATDAVGKQGTLRSKIVRGTGGSFLLKGIKAGLSLVTSVILARVLGTEGYGIYAYAISWVRLLIVPSSVGVPMLLTREVANYEAREEWGMLRGVLSWTDRVALGASLFIALAGAGTVWWFQGALRYEMRLGLYAAMGLLPLLTMIRVRQGGIRGLHHVVEAQLPRMLVLPVVFLVLVGSLHYITGVNSLSALLLKIAAALAALLLGEALLRRRLPASTSKARRIYSSREWIRSSLPFLFARAGNTASQQWPIVLTGTIAGPEAAGMFNVVRKVGNLVKFTLDAVNMPLAPAIANLYDSGETKRLQRVATRAARLALIGALPVALGLTFFGEFALSFFGEGFTQGATALAVICAAQIIEAGAGSVGYILNMSGHEIDTAWGAALMVTVITVSGAVLIPPLGVEGTAISYFAGVSIVNVVLAVRVYSKVGINSTVVSM